MSGPETLSLSVKPKRADEALMEAAVRNVRVGGIQVEVCRRIGTFERSFCEVVGSLLDCILETNIVSDWRMFPPPSVLFYKQRVRKLAYHALLCGHAKWESGRPRDPARWGTQAGVLVGTISRGNNPVWTVDRDFWQKSVSASQR